MTSPFKFEDPFEKLERIRNMFSAGIADASAQSINDRAGQQPPAQIDPNTLTPQMTSAPQPDEAGGRKSFFERMQSFAEVVPGTILANWARRIPGEQGTFEKNLNQVKQDLETSHGQATNPWQSLRRIGMENAEAWRRTDMPSINLDVNPFGPINLPGDRTFDRVDFGVKGAAELIADPLNYIPFAGIASKGVKGSAMGLRAAGAGTVVEAISHSKNAAIDLTQSYKNIIKPRADLPIPAGTVAERVRQRQSVMAESKFPLNSLEADKTVEELRVFRGISGTGDPLDPTSGLKGAKQLDDFVAGPGVYVSRSPYQAEGFSGGYKKGKVQEYELDLYTNDQSMYEGVLNLHDDVDLLEATQPNLFTRLDEDFDSLWFSGIERAKGSDVGSWFFNVQAKYSETELRVLRRKTDAGEITEKQYERQSREVIATGQKEFNEDLLKAGVKVIDNSAADVEKELIVLDKFILKPVESRRVSSVPEVHMLPDAQEIVEGFVDTASTEIPSWVQKVKDGSILPGMEGLPPLRWAFSKINPLVMMPTGGDSVARTRSLALTSHQIRQSRDGGRVLHSVTNLSAVNGYSKTKDGLFESRNFSGVFDSQEGFLQNVVDADGKLVVWATEGRDMNKNNLYALFEGAFAEDYGLDFSKKFKGEIQPSLQELTPAKFLKGEGLITELTDESIEELISKGLSRDFVDQAFAIKQVQDWAEDAKMLLKERGVPVQEVYPEDSAWSYIFRQAVSIEGRDLSGRGKIAGSVPTYGKDRSYVGEDILDSLFTRNVKYRDNFLVAGTDFMDSVYKSVRDTDLHNSFKKVGIELRKEHLEAPQKAFKAAARNRQLGESAIGQVRKLQSEAKGVKKTKILDALPSKVRENLGFDASTMQAEDVLQTQKDAVGKAVVTANELAKEARDIQVAVSKLTNRSAWNFLLRIGVGGTDEAITDLGSTFGNKYPELAAELNKLKGLDTRVKQNTPVTETRAVGVPVTSSKVKPAHTYKVNIWGETVIDEPYTQPWVSYTKMRDSVSKQISGMKKQVGVPGGTKAVLPKDNFIIETYAVKGGDFSYIVENIKTTKGSATNKWHVYIRDGSKKGGRINNSPLVFDDLKGIDELSPVIASDTAGKRGFQPSYIPREGEAYQATQRQMKVQTKLGDPEAVEAFSKARKKLASAINRDTGAKVRNARRAKGEVKLFKAYGGFTGRQREWIREEFPALFNELQNAVDIDVPGIRRERLRKVEVALKEEVKSLKAIEKTKKALLKKERQRFGGPVTVTKDSLETRQAQELFGGYVKTGAYSEFTGKHALEIVEGESHAKLTKAGKAIIIREAKKDKLQFLKGLYFREEDVVAIEKALLPFDTSGGIIGRTQSFFLQDVPAAGDIARVLKAGFDFGAPFLQGIPLLARRPDIWAKATVRHYKIAFQGRGFHQAYVQKNIDVVREMVELNIPLGAGATDYFNALHRGGAMEQLGGFINTKLGVDAAIAGDSRLAKKAGQSVKGTGEKFMAVGKTFEESFEGFNDYARIEMFKALRNTAAKSEGGMQELGAFIRNMTGALDSTALGVSQSQQAFERGWMFFSPRYTRASLALMADAFQGGLRGQQARQTFVQMAGGGAVAYMAFAGALRQPIKLDPRPVSEGGDGAKFMTVEINGQNVGIGGFWTSMIRLIGNTATWDVDSPAALIKPNTRDNPIARWLRSRSAPTTGLATDWWNGANFLGESIEGAGGWSQHILKQTLPFTIENAVFEDGPIFGRLTAGVPAEFAGGRTFPVSAFEYRNLERERSAQARFGKGWDELNGLQKDSLENDPKGDLGRFTEVVRNEATKIQPADPRGAEQAINDYFEARRGAEMTWRSSIREGVNLFENEGIDTVVFKERYLEPANSRRRTELELQREDESYLEVEKYFSELSEKNGPLLPEDEAFGEYINKIVAADFTHPVVGFDFRAKDKAEADFGLKYGQETLQYVKDRFTAARESYDFQFPALIDELYVGRSKFEYYFKDTEGEVLSRVDNPEYVKEQYERYIYMSELNRNELKEKVPELKRFLSILQKTRRALRQGNAELDAFLYRWGFTSTLAHEVNDFVDAEVYYRTHSATTFPYPVPEN